MRAMPATGHTRPFSGEKRQRPDFPRGLEQAAHHLPLGDAHRLLRDTDLRSARQTAAAQRADRIAVREPAPDQSPAQHGRGQKARTGDHRKRCDPAAAALGVSVALRRLTKLIVRWMTGWIRAISTSRPVTGTAPVVAGSEEALDEIALFIEHFEALF